LENLPAVFYYRTAPRVVLPEIPRLLLTLLYLPVAVGSLVPLRTRRRRPWALYLLTMIMVAYVIGLSSLYHGNGERMRYPALAMLLLILAGNLSVLSDWIRRRNACLGDGASSAGSDKSNQAEGSIG
jgi:hypothetical protein